MKKYDSTVARIAGNIASGIVSGGAEEYRTLSEQDRKEFSKAIAWKAVQIARDIVAEVERTEPDPPVESRP